MGMFDREPLFEQTFSVGTRFVLTDARYVGQINTREGPAEKVLFQIVSRDEPNKKITYTALGTGFANQARRAQRTDFPVVVEYVRTPTGTGSNEVKLLVPVPGIDPRAFIDGDDGPALPVESLSTAATGPSDDDIPF